MTSTYRYQSGGSLPLDFPSYITRQADDELFQALLSGVYCYVLNSRQMGKSSLRVRTVKRLLESDIRCVEIELLGIGSQQVTASQWYGGIIQLLNSRLGLKVNRREWLKRHEDLSPVQRLGTFVDEVVIPQLNQPLVIFFDEIDSVLGLNFPTEDFFGLIRSLYEKRASTPNYRLLTIVMLGVATPSELMSDRHSTPFNIGRAIPLQGFTLQEAQPLRLGLESVFTDSNLGLSAILDWTGGQPFLTQKVCQLVVKHGPALTGSPRQIVDEIVDSYILNHWEVQDEPEHLRTIRNRLLLGAQAPERLLRLYQKILKRDGVVFDNRSSEQVELRFSGLVTQKEGRLKVFNRVYQTVFDSHWVEQQLRLLEPTTSHQDGQSPSLIFDQQKLLWLGVMWSSVIAVLTLGIQILGWFQPLELLLFDQFLRRHPLESPDDRFLIITVDEADIQYQDQAGYQRTGGALADTALLGVLQKIGPYQPRVVGVDFYHEAPYLPELQEQLDDRLVAICEKGRTVDVANPTSIAAPPDLDIRNVGFSDFAIDDDYVIRRHLIGMDSNDACPTQASFSLRLALRYLQPENITLTFDSDGQAQLGTQQLKRLMPTSGGYQLRDDFQGYQLLTRYRFQHPQEISLRQVLGGEFDDQLEHLVGDRIVLLGLANGKDNHAIPIQNQRLPGVIVHAHMTSQLISVVLDQHPLIRWLPDIIEIFGMVLISFGGMVIVWWRYPRHFPLFLMIGGGCLILIFGYGMLVMGIWVPVVPSMFAWLGSVTALTLHCQSFRSKLS